MSVVDSGASMHMLSKKDSSSDEMETLRSSRNHTTVGTSKKCKQTRKHKCMFTISICSWQCSYSKKRQQFYRLVSFVQNTDVHTRGKMWKPRLTKHGETISWKVDNFVLLVIPGLSSSVSSSSASTWRPTDQSKSSGESEASTDPMTTRRCKHACGQSMQTNPNKQAS